MIAERLQFPGGIKAGLEEMKTGGAVEIMLHIILPIPQELDGRTGLLRNPGRLNHVVVHQSPPESAAATNHVDGDVRIRQAQRLRDDFSSRIRILRRRPDFHLAVVKVRRAILRLQRCVRNEWITVRGLQSLRGRAERLSHVAVGSPVSRQAPASKARPLAWQIPRCFARRSLLRPRQPAAFRVLC